MSAARGRGGLRPSNTAAVPRAFLLVVVAAVIGLVLLWKGLDSTPVGSDSSPPEPAVVAPDSDSDSDSGLPSSGEGYGSGAESTESTPTTSGAAAATVPPTTNPPQPEPTHAPNEVKVLVANGSGVSGAAGKVTDMLSPQGWAMESPANADKTSISGIYYRAGYVRDARVIQEYFGEPPDLLLELPASGLAVPPNAEDRVANADIVVILGSDLAIQGS